MFCYRCATPIPENSRFCLSCGALVPDATLQTPGAETQAEGADSNREMEMLLRAETAGEYEVLREIGRGAMGVVYLAREIALARDVAMKVLPPQMTFGPGAVSRFRREARTAAALEHPSIVPVYRVTPGGRLFWYTMKYLEGRSLGDVLKEQTRLPLAPAITILERVASALDYAHQRHVIHRDVKPGNVMLETHGHVIVTDFGIAKETAGGPASEAIVGTPLYMSPEQCQGGTLTGASDQYALGVLAYQMLTGRLPFDGSSIVELLQKHVVEAPPPLPELPRHVEQAIARALAKNPRDRFPSVTAFVRALMGPMDDSTVRLPRYWSIRQRVRLGTSARPQRKRYPARVWGVGGGLAGAALLVAAFWWTRHASAGAPPLPPAKNAAAPTSAPAVTQRSVTVTSPATPTPRAVARSGRGLLIVQTAGGWARLYVDAGTSHEGTSYRELIQAGKHTIHLERDGYRTVDTTVTVGARDTVVVRLALRSETR